MEAARAAAEGLREDFARPVEAETKVGGEPVCEADRRADAAILRVLRERGPACPILSEEQRDDGARLSSDLVWIVDPLDGTREFLHQVPEFAVHVALVRQGQPEVGVVWRPLDRAGLVAVRGQGCWLVSERSGVEPEPVRVAIPHIPVRVTVTRMRHSTQLETLLQRLLPCSRIPCGSAGVKAWLVAVGQADVFLGATRRMNEWDCCAPQLVVEEAGGRCTDLRGRNLTYNRPQTRLTGGFLASAGEGHDMWLEAIAPVLGDQGF